MKCPKCGFNSFEYYDSCSKCSSDLTGYKQTYSIASMILPLEAKEKLAAEFKTAEDVPEQDGVAAETHNDIFAFDLPDDSPSAPVNHNNDPFNFDEPSTGTKQSSGMKREDDVFADLLESTSQTATSPFADVQAGAGNLSAPTKAAASPSEPGEFDLESFSWDDTSEATVAPGTNDLADDFDTLFGDSKENSSK